MRKLIIILAMIGCLSMLPTFAFAESQVNDSYYEKGIDNSQSNTTSLMEVQKISTQEAEIVLKELGVNEFELSESEKVAMLTSGTATVWNTTYKSEYNIKKSFSMTANLNVSGTRPYTTFTITNKGKTQIIAIAYKGSIGGSNTIRTVTVPANSSTTLKVTRAHVIKYGTMTGQGNTSVLPYTISLYNANGNAISFSIKGIRYN